MNATRGKRRGRRAAQRAHAAHARLPSLPASWMAFVGTFKLDIAFRSSRLSTTGRRSVEYRREYIDVVMAILPALSLSSSERDVSMVVRSGVPVYFFCCLLDFHCHCCPHFVRYVHRGADGSYCACGYLLSVVTLESHGSEIGGILTGVYRRGIRPSGRPRGCGSFELLTGTPELEVSGTGHGNPETSRTASRSTGTLEPRSKALA